MIIKGLLNLLRNGSVSIFDQISENNQESSHDTPSSTIIQEDPMDNEKVLEGPNDANSNGLNTVTSGRKDKVSQKKKASIKPKDEESETRS